MAIRTVFPWRRSLVIVLFCILISGSEFDPAFGQTDPITEEDGGVNHWPFGGWSVEREAGYWDKAQFHPLGTLRSAYEWYSNPLGVYTMVARFEDLTEHGKEIDLESGYDYRWLQVITSMTPLPENLKWAGGNVDTFPFVDNPKGGFEYLSHIEEYRNNDMPFYWIPSDWEVSHEDGEYSWVYDTPNRLEATYFLTCLCLYDSTSGDRTIYLLDDGCFTWGMKITELKIFGKAGRLEVIDGEETNLLDLPEGTQVIWTAGEYTKPETVEDSNSYEQAAYLEEALVNAGFDDWRVLPTCPDCPGLPAER